MVGCTYLRPGQGVRTGPNLSRLNALGGLVSSLQDAWLWFADWNVEPEVLEATGWLQAIGAQVLTASDVSTTSKAGDTMYDFVVASRGALQAVAYLRWEARATWRAHKGLEVGLHRRPVPLYGPKLALPRPFPSVRCKRSVQSNVGVSKAARQRRRRELELIQKQKEGAAVGLPRSPISFSAGLTLGQAGPR